jgi:hypothetical protein
MVIGYCVSYGMGWERIALHDWFTPSFRSLLHFAWEKEDHCVCPPYDRSASRNTWLLETEHKSYYGFSSCQCVWRRREVYLAIDCMIAGDRHEYLPLTLDLRQSGQWIWRMREVHLAITRLLETEHENLLNLDLRQSGQCVLRMREVHLAIAWLLESWNRAREPTEFGFKAKWPM